MLLLIYFFFFCRYFCTNFCFLHLLGFFSLVLFIVAVYVFWLIKSCEIWCVMKITFIFLWGFRKKIKETKYTPNGKEIGFYFIEIKSLGVTDISPKWKKKNYKFELSVLNLYFVVERYIFILTKNNKSCKIFHFLFGIISLQENFEQKNVLNEVICAIWQHNNTMSNGTERKINQKQNSI